MARTAQEALEFIQENDVRFIRLAFCDIFGGQKNISVVVDQLEHALFSGITLDVAGVPGFGGQVTSNVLLQPDPDTLTAVSYTHLDVYKRQGLCADATAG